MELDKSFFVPKIGTFYGLTRKEGEVMLNEVQLMGRFARDPEAGSYGQNGQTSRFTLAVDRIKRQGEDQPKTDWIRCIAFGKTAEYLNQYAGKGDLATVTGSIQTGSYQNQEGKTIYTTDVVVRQVQVVRRANANNAAAPNAAAAQAQATPAAAQAPATNEDPYQELEDAIPF